MLKRLAVMAVLAASCVFAIGGSTAQAATTTPRDEFTVCAHLGDDIVAYKMCRQAIHWDPRTGPELLKRCEALHPKRVSLPQRQAFYVCEAYITDRLSV